jgi:predicted membrane metal-binding protein
MSDLVVKVILSLICLGIAFWAFQNWRRKKNLWLLLAVITAVLAAAAFWLGLVNGAFLSILAAALLFLGLWTKRGRQ